MILLSKTDYECSMQASYMASFQFIVFRVLCLLVPQKLLNYFISILNELTNKTQRSKTMTLLAKLIKSGAKNLRSVVGKSHLIPNILHENDNDTKLISIIIFISSSSVLFFLSLHLYL